MNWRLFFSALFRFLLPIARSIGRQLSREVLETALEFAVQAATHRDWSNGQKRVWVAEQIRQWAIATGYPLADSVINLAIELAVRRLKG